MTASLARQKCFDDPSLIGAELCHAYSRLVDEWVVGLFDDECGAPAGVAVVAVGGYGRAELAPQSDIDLLLLHAGVDGIGSVAERLWYPMWDEGLKLGHSVRTHKEAMTLAASDLDTATSLLDVRHLAGDTDLTRRLQVDALALWKKRNKRWLGEMSERVAQRQQASGEVAFLLEPDLKEGRGGLRDVHAIRWAEAAERVMFEGDDAVLAEAYDRLLDARVELHRRTRRPSDVLLLQEQDAVAAALGAPDADAFMATIAASARTIAWRSDEVWDRIDASLKGATRWRSARDRPLAEGVILREGRVHVSIDAEPGVDPALVLRVAAEAARHGTRIDRPSLERLAAEAPPMPDPWPDGARANLVDLLLAGEPAITVIESLDQVGLWCRILPEWEPNRSRPQRNAYHRFTVDRHLCEAAVEASALVDRVERPDLLVLGALLHDIGKGYPGDHTEVGIDLVRPMGARMGLAPDDVDRLAAMVEHHLLLPDIATRRDLGDGATIRFVADRIDDRLTLSLLGALTEADSLATGSAAWGAWKAELVALLVHRVDRLLAGEVAVAGHEGSSGPTSEQLELLEGGREGVSGTDDRLTVVSRDRPGLFSRVAGALALNGLDVLDASAYSHDNQMAIETFRVESSLGPTISWDRVITDVEECLAGRLALDARLAERARVYGGAGRGPTRSPEVVFDTDLSPSATVVEVHAPNEIGLLYRLTRTFAELDLDIRSAKVQTLGADVVDSFYVVDADGGKPTAPARLDEIERAILFALG